MPPTGDHHLIQDNDDHTIRRDRRAVNYHTTRQFQAFLINDMRTPLHSRTEENLRDLGSRFEFLVRSFENFRMETVQTFSTLTPRIARPMRNMAEKWNLLDALEELKTSFVHQRDFLATRYEQEARRENKRQEFILFAIALLQVFAVVSAVSDHIELNPSLRTAADGGSQGVSSNDWRIERRVASRGQWLLPGAILFNLVVMFVIYGRLFWNSLRGWQRKVWRGIHAFANHRKLSFRTQSDGLASTRSYCSKTSCLHGTGLFANVCLTANQVIMRFPAGERRLFDGHTFPESLSDVEWNVVAPNVYYVRQHGTDDRLINHHRCPNARVEFDDESEAIQVIAEHAIEPAEEITIDYRPEPLSADYIRRFGGYL